MIKKSFKFEVHKGMRPHDVVVLLKIFMVDYVWQYRDIAGELGLSISEVHRSVQRSAIGKLYDMDLGVVISESLIGFLEFGIAHVFPAQPGKYCKGIATAHSHPAFGNQFFRDIPYVWPCKDGDDEGLSITPLIPTVQTVIYSEPGLFSVLAAIEILRLGSSDERTMAAQEIRRLIE